MKGINVLICEDEALIAHDIQSNLEEMGYTVSGISESCEDAIKNLDAGLPDIALMDICLKGDKDGIETARLISGTYSIPVIYLTSLTDAETLEKAKKTEPLGYINKPFKKNELKNAIEMGLYRHRQQTLMKKEFEKTKNQLAKEKSKISTAERIIEMQKELMEVQKMEAVRKLTAGIAHHVNNTLYAVIGSLQYISECVLDRKIATSQIYELISSVLEKCDRTSLVVQKLLLFSESSDVETQPSSAGELISEALHTISPVIKNSARIETFLASAELMIDIDKPKVKQVIADLVMNAHDSLAGEGVITIATGLVRKEEVTSFEPVSDYYFTINISDNGAGMHEAILKHAAEPFFSTKNNGEALGLGLTMAYSVMQRHGGEIIISSFQGIGTSVTLYFPYQLDKYQTNGSYH